MCFCLAFGLQYAVSQQNSYKTWEDYGGHPDSSKFMDLTQITKSNVNSLQVAWSYPTHDGVPYGFTPIIVGKTMYVLARGNSLVALDATTGKEIWVQENLPTISYRGISYWESKDHKDKRLIFQINQYLEELNADTGKPIMNFGDKGLVDLRFGLGRDSKTIPRIMSNTPGKVFEDLIMIGSAPGEAYMSAPGDLRAYNVITGKIVWTFHTVPHPGEPGYETMPKDAWKYIGGENEWGEMSLDEKAGIAYFTTGAPTYDMYGADRVGQDLYGDCLLAINARTGKLIWYFQDVHHDLWDYDLCAAPQLITIHRDGKEIPAVALAGKTAFLYVFNRYTGKPIWPIEERPVPKSDVPGEQAWPTQPVPTAPPPFARQEFTSADINPYLMSGPERTEWTARINAMNNHGMFTPPSFYKETVEAPGAWGGANFGATSANPSKGLVYVLYDNFVSIVPKLRVTPIGAEITGSGTGGAAVYADNCAACHGADKKGEGAAPSLLDMADAYDLQSFELLVASGKGDMPAFAGLNRDQLEDLFAFLTAPAPGSRARYAALGPKTKLGGPVVGSGGVPGSLVQTFSQVKQYPGKFAGPPYPDGVQAPLRLYADYGLDFPFIINPPWSGLAAYDLNKGTIAWNIRLGEDPEAIKEGAKDPGVLEGANHRGTVVTSTGLLFVDCADGKLRAYDASDGKVLWSYDLPAAAVGNPASYEVDGREYLVVSATSEKSIGRQGLLLGGTSSPVPSAEELAKRAWIAFALPK
jgi:quinoprotein glucose dehydrogenase